MRESFANARDSLKNTMHLLTTVTRLFGLFGEGRSPAMLLNLGVPDTGYRAERDIAYGAHRRQRMDIYVPNLPVGPSDTAVAPQEKRGKIPVVVFFYGGAFRAGRKSEYRFAGQALASAGVIVAIPDYRIYPEARFPDFLQDGAAAIAKCRELCQQFGGDPERLFLMGHSAGAYITVMLTANDAWLRAQGGDASWIRGAIALSGRYHQSPLQDQIAETIFRGPARDETRPASFIRGKCAPMFLAAGSREDEPVLIGKHRLAAHLRETGNLVEERLYAGIGHAGIIGALAPARRNRAAVFADVMAFIGAG